MKRLLILCLSLVIGFGLAGLTASAQTPAKVTVTPGMSLDVGRDGYGCTMGAVGTDKFGNLIGISAAHCLSVGADVFFPGKRDLGPIGKTVYSYPNGGQPGSEPDYSVVKYDPAKVVLDSDGRVRVDGTYTAEPRFGLSVCKGGSTTGRTCGFYTYTAPSGNVNGYLLVLPGDSGGPLVAGTKWLGIVSRIDFDVKGPFSFASSKAILADLAKRPNDIGAGFVPTNA